jgi:MinD superfamily P-loop ATPase
MFRQRVQPVQTKLEIDHDKCYSCGACVAVCPPDALFLHDYTLTVEDHLCTRCDRCVAICPVHALELLPVVSAVQ